MKRLKGIVRGNVIVLDKDVRLPEGTTVEVRVKDPDREAKLLEKRREAIQRILEHQIPGPVGMAEIIEEDKRERDERWDRMFGGEDDAKPQEPPAA
jgi:hypothetical protein